MSRRQLIALTACLIVGVAGFVGAYAVEQSREHKEHQEAAAQDQDREPTEETSTIVNPQPVQERQQIAKASEMEENTESETLETMADAKDSESESQEKKSKEEKEEKKVKTAAKDGALHFTPQNGMRWPMEGEVLLNYSMDHRIFFPTMQQYQYNPALIIGGDVNSKVYLAAEGVIKNIETNEETGCTVTEDLGDGYTAIYGQLKDLNFSKGEHVERGQVIGYVSEPTKYYSTEGSNLYFAMQKDGKPIDPLEYFE